MALSHRILPGKSLKRPQSPLLKSSLLFTLLPALRILNSTKISFDLHPPKQPLALCEQEVQQSASPYWLLYPSEVITSALQDHPGSLTSFSQVPPADMGVAEVMRTRACEHEAAPVFL